MTENGDIRSVSMYHSASTNGSHLLLGVYSDASGAPSTLLGVTPVTVVSTAQGWQTVALTSPVPATAGQKIWLAWLFENNPGVRCAVRNSWKSQLSCNSGQEVCLVVLELQLRRIIHTPFIVTYTKSTSSISVITPNGGESWQVGSSHNITWTSSGTSGNVRIEYSTNNGSSWTNVIASTPDDGSYSWTIPNTPSTTCLIRVSDTDGSPSDVSNSVFSITSGTCNKILGYTTVFGSVTYDANRRALAIYNDRRRKSSVVYRCTIVPVQMEAIYCLAVYSDASSTPSALLGVTPVTLVSTAAGWQTVDTCKSCISNCRSENMAGLVI